MVKTFWTWTGDLRAAPKVVSAKTPSEAAEKALDGFSDEARVLVIEPCPGPVRSAQVRAWAYRLELTPVVVLMSERSDEPPPAIRYAHPEPAPAPTPEPKAGPKLAVGVGVDPGAWWDGNS